MSETEDPVVVTGLAVEAPGGVETPEEFWRAVSEARDLIGPFPRDRDWPVEQLLGLGERDGWGVVSDAGGFLAGAGEFDPAFFGITPREAVAMEPQQRVALRVAWKAVENAGMNPSRVAGEEAGCYVGASAMEYGPRVAAVSDHSGHLATGTALGAVSGRIAYHLGLVGPTMTVDAACASSLAAIHVARGALQAQECDWALAGGVCVMGSPAAFFEFSKQNALSPDGRCRSYSAEANGTLWGEGAAFFVLEKASRARRLGHRVLGRLLATRVNHVGRSKALAVPTEAAQERVVRAALRASGVAANDIGLVEGHGTATAVGDPIELAALQRIYGEDPERGAKLGSVKSNLGHTQAASGAMGLAKVLLCGQHGMIAPSRYADKPTARVDWASSSLQLARSLEPWPARDGVRHGAVSAFGFGGTGAHVIVAMPETASDVEI